MNTVDVTLRTAAAVERKKMRAERFALLRRNPAFIAGVVIAMFGISLVMLQRLGRFTISPRFIARPMSAVAP